jgi:transcriptional antiterminator RfaH
MINPEVCQWFAIQTHPGTEGMAASRLQTLPVETLLPLTRKRIRHATRAARIAVRPLFPGYLFGRFSPATSLRAVKYSRGVLRVVGAADRPSPVEDAIVASIRARVGADGCIELTERPLTAGDAVRISAGPLIGWAGIFDSELSDAQRVVILIETLQQGRVVIRRDWLELSDAA